MTRLDLALPLDSGVVEAAQGASCRACGHRGLEPFYAVDRVPAQTCVLLDSAAEAESYPTGDILLVFCSNCGFIQNERFDPSAVDYSKPTEESQAFSPRFTEFASHLADDLVKTHDLVDKCVFEVGCGKGDFLQLLLDRGVGSAIGMDPGYISNREGVEDPRVEYRREWYDGSNTGLTGDLVLTRHLMEHVPNVTEFFGWLVESARKTNGSVVFTEVPDTRRVLSEGAFWDVYHEHCSYFTIGSLARTLRGVGLAVEALSYGYDDQYLLATASVTGDDRRFDIEEPPTETAALVETFSHTANQAVSSWRSRIEGIQGSGGSVAVWGGGSKAVAFLAAVGAVDVTVVDINPHKQGKWLPGSTVMVEDPGVLVSRGAELVIAMNPIYEAEIIGDLNDMGLAPMVASL